ncbi:Hypothetical protein A7982_00265 [Minicystis rosea]|nr:Hypothetical protein A7982_00265 [Minicystis rosea]
MSMRTLLPALLALVCSCSAPEPDPVIERPPFAVTMTGPTGPFRGAADVTAIPEPADGVVEVRFQVDDDERAVDKVAPYAASLDFSLDWGGAHRITAVAVRDDGSKAEASIEVSYDPLGPFVTVVKPATGLRVSPSGAMVDVAFAASDPNGLAAGSVQLTGGMSMAVPLPSLAFAIEVPKALDLPAKPELSWWFDDTLGNRTQGSLSFLQSYERFSAAFGAEGRVYPLSGGRLAVLSKLQLRALEPDGGVAWVLDGPPSQLSEAIVTVGGDLLVMWTSLQLVAQIQRVHPDGTVAWTWLSEMSPTRRMAYVAESDSLLFLQRQGSMDSFAASLIGPTGQTTFVRSFPSDQDVWPFVSPPGASPGGFALGSTGGDVNAHYDVYDAAGTPAWSCELSAYFDQTKMLTRDAIYGPLPTQDANDFTLVGPSGTIADLGKIERFLAMANGDVVVSTFTGTDSAVTRLRPDGSTVWQVPFPAYVTELSGGTIASGQPPGRCCV